MSVIKAPCLNRFCSETAEFKKGSIKWVAKCPSCGSQFYQSKKAKEEVELYLEKHKPVDENQPDGNSNKPNKTNEQSSGEDSKDNLDKKPKARRLFARPWRKAVA